MTGHVAKQLAELFMDQQLWEEISKYQLDTHTHTHTKSHSNFNSSVNKCDLRQWMLSFVGSCVDTVVLLW